jgi:hypothetical protein
LSHIGYGENGRNRRFDVTSSQDVLIATSRAEELDIFSQQENGKNRAVSGASGGNQAVLSQAECSVVFVN